MEAEVEQGSGPVIDDEGKVSLFVLDQLLLPHETKYVPIKNVEDA